MDSNKVSIRPVLNLSSPIPIEDFQNKTLRPIIKLQHHLILQLFVFFCKKQKIDVLKVEDAKFDSVVNTIIKKNIAFRNQFIGLIVGHFTVNEFMFYYKEDSEINKRILTMVIQRINDSHLEIKNIKTN